jgi:hypothetical protein
MTQYLNMAWPVRVRSSDVVRKFMAFPLQLRTPHSATPAVRAAADR